MRQKVKGEKMVHFIGTGPGDPELLTIKGKKLIDQADVIIYAGSLVNKEVLAGAKEGAEIYNSATMTLEEVIEVMKKASLSLMKDYPKKTKRIGQSFTMRNGMKSCKATQIGRAHV